MEQLEQLDVERVILRPIIPEARLPVKHPDIFCLTADLDRCRIGLYRG